MNVTSMCMSLLFAVLLTSCAGGASAGEGSGSPQPTTPDGYKGPAMDVSLDALELSVSIEVRSGGYRLELRETARADTHTDVKLRFTAPANDEGVTQAFEVKVVKISLKPESGPIHVHLQQIQRGLEYLVEPEFQLGKIIPR
jgi:hypothetical protein